MEDTKRVQPKYWKNIYLVGFMGSGKSTVAKDLAEILDVPIIELDRIITDYLKMSIPDIFKEYGEESFRATETLMLTTSITGHHVKYDVLKGAIFSCGGGIVLSELNVTAMQNTGKIVWLKAEPETIWDRVQNDESRPLIKGMESITDVREMMELREPYYQEAADLTINIDNKTPAEIAGEIVMALDLIPNLS